jgi:hypothetical protein
LIGRIEDRCQGYHNACECMLIVRTKKERSKDSDASAFRAIQDNEIPSLRSEGDSLRHL